MAQPALISGFQVPYSLNSWLFRCTFHRSRETAAHETVRDLQAFVEVLSSYCTSGDRAVQDAAAARASEAAAIARAEALQVGKQSPAKAGAVLGLGLTVIGCVVGTTRAII